MEPVDSASGRTVVASRDGDSAPTRAIPLLALNGCEC